MGTGTTEKRKSSAWHCLKLVYTGDHPWLLLPTIAACAIIAGLLRLHGLSLAVLVLAGNMAVVHESGNSANERLALMAREPDIDQKRRNELCQFVSDVSAGGTFALFAGFLVAFVIVAVT